jgi:hypothetical protein
MSFLILNSVTAKTWRGEKRITHHSNHTAVSNVTGYKQPGSNSSQECGLCFFTAKYKWALGQPTIIDPMVTGPISLGVNLMDHEADYSPPSRGKIKNVRSFNVTPIYHLHDVILNTAKTYMKMHCIKTITIAALLDHKKM